MLLPIRFFSGVMGFFVRPKARSHSQDVAGQANIPRPKRCRLSLYPPDSARHRTKSLRGRGGRAGYRISAEFITGVVVLFLAGGKALWLHIVGYKGLSAHRTAETIIEEIRIDIYRI
jgi:hypothetical protein